MHWALHEIGLDYETRMMGSRSGATQTSAFRKLNPKEKIPVLVDGDLVLTESAAIITYLADTYGPSLVPAPRTQARAIYDQWVSFILMELDAHTLYVLRKHQDLTDLYGEAPAAVDAAIAGFNKQSAVAEDYLADHEYLVEDRFTCADILLGSCLLWAEVYGFELTPALLAHKNRVTARPTYYSAAKHNFSIKPDEVVPE